MDMRKIGIIGGTHGLGKRFEKFFKEKFPTREIFVSGRETEITNKKIVQECDLVIFAVPISVTEEVIRESVPFSREEQVFIDFTSIKSQPMAALELTHAQYCGMHPLFGPLKDITGQKLVFCPGRIMTKNLNSLKKIFEDFDLIESTPDEHDKIMGVVQCVSHFSDFVFGKALKDLNIDFNQILNFSSPPYRIKLDLLARMFAQNPSLYAEISIFNKYGLSFQKHFIETAKTMGQWLEKKESETLAEEFKKIEAYLGEEFCKNSWEKSQKFLAFESFISGGQKKRIGFDEVIEPSEPFDMAVFGKIFSHTDEASFLFSQRTPQTRTRCFKNIFEVFDKVESGQARWGIVPYENTTQGSVFETLDELFERKDIQIVAARENEIIQNLLGIPGTKISKLEKIYSHPQALAQSRKFLRKECPNAQLLDENSTATAARKILDLGDQRFAAIGSKMLAENLGLEMLAENLQESENRTRFVLIEKVDKKTKIDLEAKHTSFVFWFSGDASGNLAQVLTFLAEKGVNLTKLDSRRAPKSHGGYLFFIDGEIAPKDFAEIEAELKNICGGLQVLGYF